METQQQGSTVSWAAEGGSPNFRKDLYLRWTPHPAIMDNRDYIRVLSSSYYTTITGWGVLLIYITCALRRMRMTRSRSVDRVGDSPVQNADPMYKACHTPHLSFQRLLPGERFASGAGA